MGIPISWIKKSPVKMHQNGHLKPEKFVIEGFNTVHFDMCLLGYCRLTGGGYKSKHKKFQGMERKVATLMVKGPDGELQREFGFQRITWRMRSKPLEPRVFQKLFSN